MTGDIELTACMEDYLEAILNLAEKEGVARITDIAEKLNIKKASANQTIKKLTGIGLVRHDVYGPVELTESGKKQAVKIRQRHRKLKQFLIEVLGVEPRVAEKDACLMEHVVSAHTVEKLTEFLVEKGYIKNAEDSIEEEMGSLDKLNVKSLSELKTGQKGRIIRITSKGVVRKRMLEMGITQGTELSIKGVAPLGDPIELIVKGYHLSLRKDEASDIFVEVL